MAQGQQLTATADAVPPKETIAPRPSFQLWEKISRTDVRAETGN